MKEEKPRVLYADEDRDNREFITRDLVDYEVVCATTTVDALREGKSGSFDLILLDDRLSGATGIEICQEIRALDRWTPILILSGPDNEIMRNRAIKAGAQDYWPTPVDMDEVEREIKRLVELKRAAMRAFGAKRKRESGLPGGGAGRKDLIGRTGVFPLSASEGASPEAQLRGEMSWGQGERGAEGYYDHGDSEITNLDHLSEKLARVTKRWSKAARKK
jgi:DNA-binding response OmpR family regulator